MQSDDLLLPYRSRLEGAIPGFLERMGARTPLQQAVEYALTNGGKRFRPAISLMVAEALGDKVDVIEAALAIEALHCASLVADDMPCMDDDDERRSKPSVHKVYGEGVAILVSYALIAEGYRGIARAAAEMHRVGVGQGDLVCQYALDYSAKCSGLLGATGGQFLDMTLVKPSAAQIKDVIQKKTGALFEIAFVLGWLFGGGACASLGKVESLAQHFGMAFQVMDDIGDLAQDRKIGKEVNYALELGVDAALDLVKKEVEAYLGLLIELQINSTVLQSVGLTLIERAQKKALTSV